MRSDRPGSATLNIHVERDSYSFIQGAETMDQQVSFAIQLLQTFRLQLIIDPPMMSSASMGYLAGSCGIQLGLVLRELGHLVVLDCHFLCRHHAKANQYQSDSPKDPTTFTELY
jgi:hypothetical protein